MTVYKTSQTFCKTAYEGRAIVTDNMVCAGVPGGGKDACQGMVFIE